MAITRKVEAVVLSAEGEASASASSGSPTRFDLRAGARISPPASMVTNSDATLALSAVPGALVELEQESELRLMSLKITKNGNRVQEAIRREVRLQLERGALVASVQFESEPAAVAIDTPAGVLSMSSPALCRVEVRNQITRVTCARGAVAFHPQGAASATVQAPESREWPAGESEHIPADFDVRAIEEIEKSKEVEQKLLGLEERRRLSPFPWRQ